MSLGLGGSIGCGWSGGGGGRKRRGILPVWGEGEVAGIRGLFYLAAVFQHT